MKSFYTKVLKLIPGSISSKYINLNTRLKKLALQWHGALIVAPSVAGLTIAIQLLGWLEPLELAALDMSFRLRPIEPTDDRIIIVGIEESDLTSLKQWPISDAILAKLLTQIKQHRPKAIGLDIYRNLPVQPGYAELVKVFKTTPNLIGIQKVIDDSFSAKIAPPPELADTFQVSANDVVVDADGVLRRGMLYPLPGEPLPSLGLAVAILYLHDKNITPEVASNGALKLGETVFTPFEDSDGSYIRADAGGYQILLNFRGSTGIFRYVSVMDVLENRVPPDLMRDRIVLIGARAPSLNDAFYTPYRHSSRGTPIRTPGVEIQANLASQIVSSVLDGRPLIKVWNEPLEKFWIFLWTVVIAGLGWKWRYSKAQLFLVQLLALLLVTVVILCLIVYIIFLFAWWIPLVPPLLALFSSTIGISSYVYISRLRELNTQLEQTVQNLEIALLDLQQSQIQLIQSEKMSTLGQLVAGVAHEINNPTGFISGNIQCLQGYVQDLTNHLQLYQQSFPNPGPEIEEDAEAIDLEYLFEDLSKLISSMETGVRRIEEISVSLRTFSRSDTSTKVPFKITEGIDSTIMILKHRLKANNSRPEIKIIKEYGDLPMVNCFPGQMNQVFMNLISNAIDALDESNQGKSYKEIEANPNKITIITELTDNSMVVIRVQDNGLGMTEEVKQKVFEHLFTTKSVGKGTGLGLSISRQIVEETHVGKLSCVSVLGVGAEFIVEIPIS